MVDQIERAQRLVRDIIVLQRYGNIRRADEKWRELAVLVLTPSTQRIDVQAAGEARQLP